MGKDDKYKYSKQNILREIPPINEVLNLPEVVALTHCFGKSLILDNINYILDDYRNKINNCEQFALNMQNKSRKEVAGHIAKKLEAIIKEQQNPRLKRVINATGIVLHTNLGRAPLPEKALMRIYETSQNYSNLEFDIESGKRGSRHSHIEPLITRITGAESSIIVNNNAAAVFLCLNTLAADKQVIISRGQQVEIGGSFRIPEIIASSGAKMQEVGTTNKTRIEDYLKAINDETSVLLKVHTSNYKITGFTEEVTLKELIELGKEKNLVVMEDLGSGSLYDISKIGLPYEPTVQDSIKSGVDIITFSGDKLLGGPQAGIIAGKKELIDKIKKNPLARIVRCDKTTIAAMEAVLSLYIDSYKALETIPVLRMMALKEGDLTAKAVELSDLINNTLKTYLQIPLANMCIVEIIDDFDEIGGGSLPGVIVNGKAVSLTFHNAYISGGLSIPESVIKKFNITEIQAKLRKSEIPVICRISKDRILLNVRTLERKDYPIIAKTLAKVLEDVLVEV